MHIHSLVDYVWIGETLISLHIRSMWETICESQAGFCTHPSNSKFLSKFSRKPLSGISDQKAPPPQWKTSDFRWPKFTPEELQIWDDQSLLLNTPPNWKTSDLRWPKFTVEHPPTEKLQIWDDQSLLWNTPPPKLKNFRFEMAKVYSGIPPTNWKTSDLRWPKFTPEYPPPEGLQSGRSYVETNLYPPWIPLFTLCIMQLTIHS